jgi:hypothetical protein
MIFKSELRPYKRLALKYIETNREHPAIAAGLRYMHHLIYASPAPPTHPSRRMSPAQRALRYISRLAKNGVSAEEALALVVSIHMLRDHDPSCFVSDDHFRAMLAHHWCRLSGGPWVQTYRAGVGARRYDRLGVGLRKYISAKINDAIGVMALGCARAILNVEKLENGLLRGVNVPIRFDDNNHKGHK